MDVREFIQGKLFDNIQVMLLYVVKSEGSSPGRQGFKMAVIIAAQIILEKNRVVLNY